MYSHSSLHPSACMRYCGRHIVAHKGKQCSVKRAASCLTALRFGFGCCLANEGVHSSFIRQLVMVLAAGPRPPTALSFTLLCRSCRINTGSGVPSVTIKSRPRDFTDTWQKRTTVRNDCGTGSLEERRSKKEHRVLYADPDGSNCPIRILRSS